MRSIELIDKLNNKVNLDVSTTPEPIIPPGLATKLEHNLPESDLRPRVAILTLGCKVNYSETEALAENFQQAGYALVDPDAGEKLDVFIVNTCTVTHVAGKKSRQMLRRAKRENPQALVVATGCHVYTSRTEVEAISEVDLVVGKSEEERLIELVAERLNYELPFRPEPSPLLFAGGFAAKTPLPLPSIEHYRTRAMVKIQDGCNAGCAFCIVPTARGGPRSIGIDEVVAGVRYKAANGYREVVLTGVHLGKYRAPDPTGNTEAKPVRLRALLERVLAEVPESDLPRLRITSLEPQDYDPTLLELWQQHSRLARHFHLALQAGCDSTLARMRRGYNTERYAKIVEQIHRELPDAAITTDIIVGFPGETDEEFEQTLAFAEKMSYSKIHVFPFSIRQGTIAATLPYQVAEQVKKERGERLRLLSDKLSQQWRSSFIGEVRPVLWEQAESVANGDKGNIEVWGGLTDNYIRVYAQRVAGEDWHNRITPTRLTGLAGAGDAEGMWGELAGADFNA